MMKKTNVKSPLLLFLAAVIWGVAFVAQSVGMEYVGPFTFNAVRSMIGGLVLIPCIYFLDSRKKKENSASTDRTGHGQEASDRTEDRQMNEERTGYGQEAAGMAAAGTDTASWKNKTLLKGGICCGVCLCIASNLQQIGISYTTVGKAGFITAMYIILVPVLGIFLKKQVGLKVWISVALGVIGLYLLCMTEKLTLGKGDAYVLLCALFFSFHILTIDHFSSMVDGVKMSCIQFLVSGILSGILMFVFEQPRISSILAAWLPILYAGVMSCGVAYTLQIVGQKDMDPTVASLILSLESVVSVLAGWALLHQHLSVRELLGCVVMFAAIILAQLPEKQKNKQ